MKRLSTVIAVVALTVSLTACGAATETDDALPQAAASSEPAAQETTEAPAEEEEKASTCDVAREAILTGSEEDKEKAFKALIADKKADATAREAAQEYFEQDDEMLKEMQVDLIQMACSL